MLDVTFCIKTLERPRSCQKCIHSIRRFYPQSPIIVVDDSPLAYEYKGSNVKLLRPGLDVGAAAGRNIAIDAVETPYMVMIDDETLSVDTPADLERAIKMMQDDLLMNAYLKTNTNQVRETV